MQNITCNTPLSYSRSSLNQTKRQLQKKKKKKKKANTRLAVSITDAYLWSQIEPATAILCACLITYKPLFKNISVSLSTTIFTSYFSRRGTEDMKEEHGGDLERQMPYDRYRGTRGPISGLGVTRKAGTFAGKDKERPVVLTGVVA